MNSHGRATPKPNKTDAGNGSKAICRFIDVNPSTSPDPRRSANIMKLLTPISALVIALVAISCSRNQHASAAKPQFSGVRSIQPAGDERAVDQKAELASSAFKTGWQARVANDYAVTRALIPALRLGMTGADIERLLGAPDGKLDRQWTYDLFYSQFIRVVFSDEGTVKEIVSTLSP